MTEGVFIHMIDNGTDYCVMYGGTPEELVRMIMDVANHDEDIKKIIHAAGKAIDYLDGMDDIEKEINNL